MFAELSITSNFTFLTGASHPEEYMERAALLGYPAIAIAEIKGAAYLPKREATQAAVVTESSSSSRQEELAEVT